jgi:hypothetical protein
MTLVVTMLHHPHPSGLAKGSQKHLRASSDVVAMLLVALHMITRTDDAGVGELLPAPHASNTNNLEPQVSSATFDANIFVAELLDTH